MPKKFLAYLAVSLFRLKFITSCYKVLNINILKFCKVILKNSIKEGARFLILSIRLLNTSAMVAAICNIWCIYTHCVYSITRGSQIALVFFPSVIFTLWQNFAVSLASQTDMTLTVLCMAKICTPHAERYFRIVFITAVETQLFWRILRSKQSECYTSWFCKRDHLSSKAIIEYISHLTHSQSTSWSQTLKLHNP